MVGGDGQILEGWRYEVFLSFHGDDTRKSFTDHLYHALRNCRINTFRDDEELPRGENIGSKLEEAIESSKILVIVFSKNYASSAWCLDELSHIMRCSKSNSQQLVLPIFYDIDPSHIRKQDGTLAESFAKHERRCPSDKVQNWRVALKSAADLSGWDLRKSHEGEHVQDIVGEILKKLDHSTFHIAPYSVGLDLRLREIDQLLNIGSDDVRVVGICGMGGIGKTTTAKAIYNEFLHRFDGKSFLADFREYSKKPEGKIRLFEQFISDIFKRRDMNVNNKSYGKVLVVIDDVEDWNQITSVGIDLRRFDPGSRIIVTTRDQHLLKQLGANGVYFPRQLNDSESLELLSRHAFRESKPPEVFLGLSNNLVKYCGGLPLAVEVLGAFLFKRSIPEWESTLELLQRTPDDTIQKKLRISFDSLNRVQKDIFLDIACFFIGMDKDYVTYILSECGFAPGIGLNVLMERCLVSETDNKLMMHPLIRDMGREIARNESPNSCGKRCGFWDSDDDVNDVLNYSGTQAVEGLSLKAQCLDTKSFSTMPKLRLLQLNDVQISGSYEHFSKRLRWLCWHKFPLEFLPSNFCLQSLVVMDMQCSSLTQLWRASEAQRLEKLKFLDLSHSINLRESPDFSYLPNLEKILLIDCKRLVLVHESIGILCDKLVLVNLKGCTKLKDLPTSFCKLKLLKTLVLSGCLKLKMSGDALRNMKALETLLADLKATREIPSTATLGRPRRIIVHISCNRSRSELRATIRSVSKLTAKPSISDCTTRRRIRFAYSPRASDCRRTLRLSYCNLYDDLYWMRTLRLSYCNLSDELLPEDIGSLSCLEVLDLRGNSFHTLQTDFASLQNLRILQLDNCSKLQSMLSLPRSLISFHLTNCISLERTPDLSECSFLQALYLTNCHSLVETPGLDKLKLSQQAGSIWSHNPTRVAIFTLGKEHLWQGHLSNEDFPLEAGGQREDFVNFGAHETGLALLCEAKEGHAESGRKSVIGYADASDKLGTVSIYKDSADEIQDELQTTKTKYRSMDSNTVKDTNAEVLRYQKQSPQATKGSHKRPLRDARQRRMVLRTFLGALGFLTSVVAWQILANCGGASALSRKNNKDKDSSGRHLEFKN